MSKAGRHGRPVRLSEPLMAKDQVKGTTSRSKAGARTTGAADTPVVTSSTAPESKKPRTSLPQFAKEVRTEARRITWPSWKETWINSVLVLILVTVTAIFFLLVDGTFSFLLQQLLRLASA
jgi:preprotein translocase subunit SecE